MKEVDFLDISPVNSFFLKLSTLRVESFSFLINQRSFCSDLPIDLGFWAKLLDFILIVLINVSTRVVFSILAFPMHLRWLLLIHGLLEKKGVKHILLCGT